MQGPDWLSSARAIEGPSGFTIVGPMTPCGQARLSFMGHPFLTCNLPYASTQANFLSRGRALSFAYGRRAALVLLAQRKGR
jgi:hypothetical protein